MNRNENFPPILVNTLAVHVAWASVDVAVEDVEQIQVHITGSDNEVKSLRVMCQENRLIVEQPFLGLSLKNLGSGRWMQIMLRLPRTWKGAAEISTITAPLTVRGLTGTDLALSTVSGDLTACDMQSITTALRTVTGSIRAERLQGEKLQLRTLSGDGTTLACGFDQLKTRTVSGQLDIDLARPFEQFGGLSLSGSLRLFVPMDKVDAALRSFSGRLRTREVSIQADGAPARATSASGHFEINCSTAATYEEE